ncbi:alpha amylase catalytic region [Beutenbergia cavernae DSM 12333]|uniref:Alpha amylase catalytic region n=1 Tax=Beutenbergia cavernae (strain ATCC BAA-8 / DSM 12333 / CCUG 43141 / JCM 11478 / NBRC 16432 / NCIMB 13614 / HKI 0122) TaxID=471853 RepID=C5C4R3_BEUC1|nr:glycoside hydrolase family 13 protein [Beutenbergia cavernae]ACQ80041.1 alpha amylase catalytic region [Beutenbergia cavernae DSM 12333]
MTAPTDLTTTTTTLVSSAHDGPTAWWRSAVIYQVYPRSFADSDGDGYGDIPGITSRLGHLARLGVDAVWLSPFYRSPQADAGYDVADYRDVDPLFGTLDHVDELIARAHQLGLRVIVDLVPNHTSDDHAWFGAALASPPGSPERARYHFADGRGDGGSEPPNNWTSVFGGPAWTRSRGADGEPGQWYLHLFDSRQPDLNWADPGVRAEFVSVLRFWLDRGVDGFRVDVAHGMVKQDGLPDWAGHSAMIAEDEHQQAPEPDTDAEPEVGAAGPMWDQEGVHEIYREWREVLEGYDGDRVLVAEAWVSPLSRLARYVRDGEMHQAFNFAFLTTHWFAPQLREVVEDSVRANDVVGAPTTWVLSNHDVVRHASRLGLPHPGGKAAPIGPGDPQPDEALGLRRARAAALLMLALPGSAYLYQGEELGLPEHTTLDDALRQDPAFSRSAGADRGRDGCRVPLPWAADAPALGFSPTGAAWLPQPDSWSAYALDAQKGVAGSTYELYREALRLRRDYRLGTGSLAWVEGLPADAHETAVVLVNRDVVVATNLGPRPQPLPAGIEILLASAEILTDDDGVRHLPSDVTVWARLTEAALERSPIGPD